MREETSRDQADREKQTYEVIKDFFGSRKQTLEDLTNKFNNTSVDNLSSRTVRRRLFESGYNRRVISKKIKIRKENRARRCSFCRQKLTWTVRNNWCKVIFSDETKVVIGADKKIYIWHRCNEHLYPECTGIMSDREKQGTISAMFWGCITCNGVGTIIPINGNMNSVKYIETLDNHLWPVVAKNFGNSAWIFQEDNAPCHVSRQRNAWKADNNIPILPWPAQSPDINVIENVWRVLKIHINRRVNYIKTKADLERVVTEVWTLLPLHYIQSLYQNLPKRIKAVIKEKGNIAKY